MPLYRIGSSILRLGGGVFLAPSVYTASHYVAPFASVSGAANDYADLGAPSWAAATNPATPTTLGTAMVRAAGGNHVRCALGVYSGVIDGSTHKPAFYPRNSGSLGNDIVFFTETAAATSLDNPGAWSELRIISPPDGNLPGGNSVMGCGTTFGSDYVIFDGWYARWTHAPSYGSKGAFTAQRTGVKFRRMYYDYEQGTVDDDNMCFIFLQGDTNTEVMDCFVEGNYGSYNGSLVPGSANHNASCITTYDSSNFLIKNCTFYNFHKGIFVKAGTTGSYGVIEYNKFEKSSLSGITLYTIAPGQRVIVRHNLGIDAGGYSDYVTEDHGHAFSVYNNTWVGGAEIGSNAGQVSMITNNNALSSITGDDLLYHNIVVINNSRTEYLVYSEEPFESRLVNYTERNRNAYYDATRTGQYTDGATVNFAGYKSQLSGLAAAAREPNSAEAVVTFAGVGNYRLANNGQFALTASDISGPIGCYVTGFEQLGVRANPGYP